MTVLVPMTQADFAAYLETSVPAYARDKVESGQWSEGNSLELARKEFEELLPQGIATPDNYLSTIRDPATQARVGILWYACVPRAGRRVAYVYDVLVDPQHQHAGHATRAFEALEREVRDRGLAGIALHVFGHNAGAQALYVRLGYVATNINMFKPVGPEAQASEEGGDEGRPDCAT